MRRDGRQPVRDVVVVTSMMNGLAIMNGRTIGDPHLRGLPLIIVHSLRVPATSLNPGKAKRSTGSMFHCAKKLVEPRNLS